MQNFFDVVQYSIRFRQRTARRRKVVENETAFVHRREQGAVKRYVTKHGKTNNQERAGDQSRGTLKQCLQHSSIERNNLSEKTGRRRFFLGRESGRASKVRSSTFRNLESLSSH